MPCVCCDLGVCATVSESVLSPAVAGCHHLVISLFIVVLETEPRTSVGILHRAAPLAPFCFLIYFLKLLHFLWMSVLPTWTYVCVLCVRARVPHTLGGQKRVLDSPELECIDGCAPREWNLNPLQEQQVL